MKEQHHVGTNSVNNGSMLCPREACNNRTKREEFKNKREREKTKRVGRRWRLAFKIRKLEIKLGRWKIKDKVVI